MNQRHNHRHIVPGEQALAYGAAFAVLVLGAHFVFNTLINHDTAHFLNVARALADGRALYTGYLDYSFPMITWLAMLALHSANLLGLPLDIVINGLFLVLIAASVAATSRIARAIPGPWPVGRAVLPGALMAVCVMSPGYDFGQRDILFVSLLAPVAAASLARRFGAPPSPFLTFIATSLAFVGAALKPTSAIALLCLAAAELILNRGNLRRMGLSTWALAALLGAYAIFCEIHYHYFSQIPPLASQFYGATAHPLLAVLRDQVTAANLGKTAIIVALAIAAWRADRTKHAAWPFAAAWLLMATGLGLMATLQRRGYSYHMWPLEAFLTLSLCMALALFADQRRAPAAGTARAILWQAAWMLGIAVAPLILFDLARLHELPRAAALADPATRTLAALPPGSYVLILSNGLAPVSQLSTYTATRPSGVVSEFSMIYGLILDRDRARAAHVAPNPTLAAFGADLRRRTALSLTARPPALVLVNDAQPPDGFENNPKPFDLLAWLQEDPVFQTAWHDYCLAGEIISFQHYHLKLYRRGDCRAHQASP